MALRSFYGFEQFGNTGSMDSIESNIFLYEQGLEINTIHRTGNYSLKLVDTGRSFTIGRELTDEPEALWFGLAWYLTGTPTVSASKPWIEFQGASGNQHCRLCLGHDALNNWTYVLYKSDGSTVLDSGNLGLTPADINTWIYLELFLRISPTAGEFEIWVNNIQKGVGSSLDTYGSGNAGIGRIHMRGAYGGNIYIDDLYIDDSTRHGPVKVYGLPIDSDGDETDFTASSGDRYACVDERPYSTSDYVKSDTAGDRVSFGLTDADLTGRTVLGVSAYCIAHMTETYSATIEQFLRLNSVNYDSGDVEALSTAPRSFISFWEVNPEDSSSFEDVDLDNMQVGVELVSITTI